MNRDTQERDYGCRVETYVDKAGEHQWRVRSAGNGKIISGTSEGYSDTRDMIGAARLTHRALTKFLEQIGAEDDAAGDGDRSGQAGALS